MNRGDRRHQRVTQIEAMGEAATSGNDREVTVAAEGGDVENKLYLKNELRQLQRGIPKRWVGVKKILVSSWCFPIFFVFFVT